jgi:hypothetical protein
MRSVISLDVKLSAFGLGNFALLRMTNDFEHTLWNHLNRMCSSGKAAVPKSPRLPAGAGG